MTKLPNFKKYRFKIINVFAQQNNNIEKLHLKEIKYFDSLEALTFSC